MTENKEKAEEKSPLSARELLLCSLFAALIAVGAFIRIPIPVLPFTLQFLFANLAGLVLGRRLGALSVSVYVLAGLAGMPVFTGGGGIAYVLHPTFGYLPGFIAGAWTAGWVGERLAPGFRSAALAGAANLAVLYAVGIAYYGLVANLYLGKGLSLRTLLWYCFLLPVPGDLFLVFLSAAVAERLRGLVPARLTSGGAA